MLIHGPNILGYDAVLLFTLSDFTFITRHIHSWVSFPLWPSHFILSGAISNCPPFFPSSILDPLLPVGLIFWYHIFLCFHTWGSHSKNTGVGCHFLLQWTTFCRNSSLWPLCLGWPCTTWLIASLSYARPFATTRLWSVKRYWGLEH